MALYKLSPDNVPQVSNDGGKTWQYDPSYGKASAASPSSGAAPAAGQTTDPETGKAISLTDYINKYYPSMSALMNNAEIKALLLSAAQQDWTESQVIAQFRNTAYWKQHTAAQNTWTTLSPAEKQNEIRDTGARMYQYELSIYGAGAMPDKTLDAFMKAHGASITNIASGARTFEYWQTLALAQATKTPNTQAYADELRRKEDLAQELKRPQEVAEQIFQSAHGDYFLGMSKGDALNWANNIINGKSSFGELSDYMRAQAATLYPYYKEAINNGVKPGTLFAPAMDTLSKELETSKEAVVNNSKLWGEITSQAAGAKQPFTAADWTSYARSLPDWKRTEGAANYAADFSSKVLKEFGSIG